MKSSSFIGVTLFLYSSELGCSIIAMAQYRLIAQLCGSPDEDLLAKLASNEAILNVIKQLGVYPRKCFAEYFPSYFAKDLVDFLDRILVLDPEKRFHKTRSMSSV